MKPLVLIVTGLSGSGKTIALRALEDSGFSCVDNLPPQLMDSYASTVTQSGKRGQVAVGIDIREKDFLHVMDNVLPLLRDKYDLKVLFLEAEIDVLLRRFKETRRPHPLVQGEVSGLEEAITLEKSLMSSMREGADRIVDTSSFTPHQLRQYISSVYGEGTPGGDMRVTVMSFGFKYGLPQGIDMLLDVRFLPNPHFIPELRGLTGKDAPVRDFVLDKEVTREFIKRISDLLGFLVPHYRREGKAYLNIGIGCTGGRHRSTAIVERLAEMLRNDKTDVNVLHRDL
ncbi:MAG TPA: RNase adapter RapZ [Nitrospirae bacterium]|nr:RNase adapter RapZ [Nitrospirota bacterium]